MTNETRNEQLAGSSGPVSDKLSTATSTGDARVTRGAYVTDGINLYEVTSVRRGPGMMGLTTVRVELENCRSFTRIELLPDKIQRSFSLVRRAPVGVCPDLVEDIAWS